MEQVISKTPNVCGGVACINRTRIPVWALERYRQRNVDISIILESYPFISESDIRAAWIYADNHRDEIEEQIRENE
jgi:uncharacterized protein (DUF433 family)